MYIPVVRVGLVLFFFFSSRRRHTIFSRDWSSDVCFSDLVQVSHPGQPGSSAGHGQAPRWFSVTAVLRTAHADHGVGVGAARMPRLRPWSLPFVSCLRRSTTPAATATAGLVNAISPSRHPKPPRTVRGVIAVRP